MNLIERWKKARKANRVKERMETLGILFDTIDAALIKNRLPDEERVKFWLKFIGDRAYRVELINKMMDLHK